MKELAYNAKIAVMRILSDIVNADNIETMRFIQCLTDGAMLYDDSFVEYMNTI